MQQFYQDKFVEGKLSRIFGKRNWKEMNICIECFLTAGKIMPACYGVGESACYCDMHRNLYFPAKQVLSSNCWDISSSEEEIESIVGRLETLLMSVLQNPGQSVASRDVIMGLVRNSDFSFVETAIVHNFGKQFQNKLGVQLSKNELICLGVEENYDEHYVVRRDCLVEKDDGTHELDSLGLSLVIYRKSLKRKYSEDDVRRVCEMASKVFSMYMEKLNRVAGDTQ
jgi:hypothetical protein